jgi:twitching motility two-component system response regulator PilH
MVSAPARTKVLLIDDSELSLELAAVVLAESGFDVRTSTTVRDFDLALGEWRPDLILTDVKMPGVSGVELCRFLKSRYETAHVPVVLFSGLPPSELMVLARECEADGYLSKLSGFDKLGEEVAFFLHASPF